MFTIEETKATFIHIQNRCQMQALKIWTMTKLSVKIKIKMPLNKTVY